MHARGLVAFASSVGALACQLGWAQPLSTATPVPRHGLEISLWAREPMVLNPVALSVDDRGLVYVAETSRRSTVDIDIRGHQPWILDDLASQSVDDLRAFFRTRMAPERSAENAKWLRDYNRDGSHDWRDLMEVRERVHVLEDSRGSGRADRFTVLAEGFNEEINGVIAGVMPWEKDVFVTIYPDLWRLRDNDGDGVAEVRESMFRGFGVHAAFDGHDLHGLTIGPDGKIYFSVGDNGFSVVNQEGRRLHHPNTGGVLRMNPDGSGLEVFATGLRNPQEIAFDEYGNLFSVDNDGDLEDERERLVYITEGSDSGWRLHWQFRDPGWSRFTRQPNYNPWTAERMWVPHFSGQPAHLTPPLANYSVGPGGFKYNPGTALNTAYARHFFLVQFPVQKVTAFQLRPRGAAFEMTGEHVLLSGMMTSAVNFGPNGALYVADWDGLWEPNEKGAIWVLDDPKSDLAPVRREVRQLLAEGMAKRPAAQLEQLLGHADMRIRQKAQFELARRGEDSVLRRLAAREDAPQLARIHALWGLGQLRTKARPRNLPFADKDPEIRAQSAKVAGDLRLFAAAPQLLTLLQDPSPRVRFHAALALGKAGDDSPVSALVRLAETNNNIDPFLRHAAVMGLTGTADARRLANLANHPTDAVRIAAVLALRRQRSPRVAAFLQDASIVVRREAVRAIHDDQSIPESLPDVAALIETSNAQLEEPIARRALNANLRLGDDTGARRLLRVALDRTQSMAWRIEALDCLGAWEQRPCIDRVEGLVRQPGKRVAGLGHRLIRGNLAALLRQADHGFAHAVTRVITDNQIDADPGLFTELAMSPQQTAAVRAQCLRFLARQAPSFLEPVLRAGLDSTEPELRIAAMETLAERDPHSLVAFFRENQNRLTMREQQLGVRLLGTVKPPVAQAFLGELLAELMASRLPRELALDLIETCRKSDDATLKNRIAAHEASVPGANLLQRLRPLLAGGDPGAGLQVYRTHVNAQCVRCHEAGGEGHQAGPVLQGIGARVSPDYLLEALLEPSARIATGFETLAVTLRDGEVLDGIKLRETTDELTLRLVSGEIQTLQRGSIANLRAGAVSAMPPMVEVLTPLEIRDLVAYLSSMKSPD